MANEKYLAMTKTFEQRLAHFVEECGEALAAAGKTQRWGLDSVNPELPASQQETNAQWLWREVEDLHKAIDRLKPGLLDIIQRQTEGALTDD